MQTAQRGVFFDDFARKQSSPQRSGVGPIQHTQNTQGASNFSRPATSNGGGCEWDRLMREREDLLQTGTYTVEDPLIKEIDR